MGVEDYQITYIASTDDKMDDGCVVYRASSIGACVRALVASRMGYESQSPPDKLVQTFADGHTAEALAKSMLRAGGVDIFNEQAECVLPVLARMPSGGMFNQTGIVVSGHIDGWCLDGAGKLVMFDIKSQSEKEYDKGWFNADLQYKYKWQLGVYMLANSLTRMMVLRFARETHRMQWHEYTNTLTVEEVVEKITAIETAVMSRDLPPCDVKPDDWGCPFAFLHDGGKVEPVVPDNKVEVFAQVAILKGMEHAAELQADVVKKQRAKIQEMLGSQPGSYLLGQWTVTIYDRAGSKSFDWSKASADGLDVSGYTKIGSGSRQMRITDQGGKNEN